MYRKDLIKNMDEWLSDLKGNMPEIKEKLKQFFIVIFIFIGVSVVNLNIANSLIKNASLIEKMVFVLFGEVAVCTYFVISEIKKLRK